MRLRPLFSSLREARPGFSLVELLVVVVLMVVVTAASFTLFQIGARHEARQQDVLNQTQNLRTALYTIARDVRMAGNGMTFIGSHLLDIYVDPALFDPNTQEEEGWFRYKDAEKYGVRAIYGTNGACPDPAVPPKICPPPAGQPNCAPDTLTIFRAEIENPLALGHLSTGFTPGSDSVLTLRESHEVGQTIANGDILAVAAGTKAVIIEIDNLGTGSVTALPLGNRFKPGAPMPGGGFTFPEGSMVYNLRNVVFVTYYIDRGSNHNRLMANYHDGTLTTEVTNIEGVTNPHLLAVAGNIEDMQVGYFLAAVGHEGPELEANGVIKGLEPDINESGLDDGGGKFARLVSLALTARSSRNREGGSRAGSTADDYTCMGLSENIALRNF
jgi:prepilin-type N-terminal cleavage/methylation domain-containing protein